MHYPQGLKTDTFVQEIKSKFEDWWSSYIVKKISDHYFGFSSSENYCNTLLTNNYDQLKYIKKIVQWPMMTQCEDYVFLDILKHDEIPILFCPGKKTSVNFKIENTDNVLIDKATSRGSTSYETLKSLVIDQFWSSVVLDEGKNLSTEICLGSKVDVKNFLFKLLSLNDNPTIFERVMILPGLFVRSMKNQDIVKVNIKPCHSCLYSYCRDSVMIKKIKI